MPEFLRLLPPDEARALLLSQLAAPLGAMEQIETASSLGRVTAEDVLAPHPLPEFRRSSVDGYAVRARDTFGATDSLPAYISLAGEIPMGAAPGFDLEPGQCALIHTGGMLPAAADAVVMLEHTQIIPGGQPARPDRVATGQDRAQRRDAHSGLARLDEIEVLRAAAVGENVIATGEDVAQGQVVIRRGSLLRPAEIGGLMALGLDSVRVARKPRIGLISTGDEVVDPHTGPKPGQVRDVNAYALASLISDSGGEPCIFGIVQDELALVQEIATRALAESEVLLISGGSSASARDTTAEVIAALGPPGVLVHGINTRPGKPTILGVCEGKAVIGLPGNPVSALVIGYLFVVPVIERLLGLSSERPRPILRARLLVNLPSQAGREDWWPVRLSPPQAGTSGWLADPIFGKSNLIFSLAASDGLVRIPPEANGLAADEIVEVYLI